MGWNTPAILGFRGPVRRAAAVLAACALSWTGLAAVAPAATAEVTGSQVQVSSSGDDYLPSSAYDSANNRYLVVWLDQSGTNDVVTGRFLSATGSPIGVSFPIFTYTGSKWNAPGVSYDETDGQFLVTWLRSNGVSAQRVAADGTLVGPVIGVSSSTYSSMGTGSAVMWSPDAGAYLVAWKGYDTVLRDDVVRGRLVTADGDVNGTSDLTIANADVNQVALGYNTVDHEFLVAWPQANPDQGWGIWARRVGTDGAVLGESSFRISHTSIPDAYRPSIAFDPDHDRYLVVWTDPTIDKGGVCGTWAFGAYEVFGQLVAADGSMSGSTFQISNRSELDPSVGVLEPACDAGPNGPNVAYDPGTGRYLLVFSQTPTDWGGWQDSEVYGDYITSAGALVGTRDFPISEMGAWQDAWQIGLRPALAFNSTDSEFMVAWFGATTQGSLTTDDYNVWANRVAASEPATPPTDTTGPQTALKTYNSSWDPAYPTGSGTFYNEVLVSANAFDGLYGSGVAQIRCVVDPTSVPATFADLPDADCTALTLNTGGAHAIYAAAVDHADNAGAVVSRTIDVTIDKTAPTLAPTVSPSSTLVLNQPGASAAANATDSGSGISMSDCDPVDTSTLGQYSVLCWAYDVAGNYGSASATYLVGYKTTFSSPTEGASYTAGKAVPVEVSLGDWNDTLISTADALAMAKAGRVTISVSGAVTLASTPMKYSRSTGTFSYRLRIPRSATTGTATITVTTSYSGTTLTAATTRSINITGLLSTPAEVLPSEAPTSEPSAAEPTAPPSPTPPAEGGADQQPGTGTPSTEGAQPSTAPETVTTPKGGHLR